MPNNERSYALSGRTDATSILEAVAETLEMSHDAIPAAARRAAGNSRVGERIRDIESTKDLSEKDFALMITTRG